MRKGRMNWKKHIHPNITAWFSVTLCLPTNACSWLLCFNDCISLYFATWLLLSSCLIIFLNVTHVYAGQCTKQN